MDRKISSGPWSEFLGLKLVSINEFLPGSHVPQFIRLNLLHWVYGKQNEEIINDSEEELIS